VGKGVAFGQITWSSVTRTPVEHARLLDNRR
jgi:hypothetical protein